jgi:peptidoglycan/xylan/chitin deacetylase (PgdA/CDA1 family)
MISSSPLLALATRGSFGLLGTLCVPRLTILIFHRVHSLADPLFPSEPDAARFERLMRFVARSFRVMTLGDAVTSLARGDLPPRALVITFDDGYADNYHLALPILARCGLAASFFISTGFLDGGRMWNDSVIECLRACRLAQIDLDSFGLGRCSLDGPAERRRVIERLLPLIKYQGLAERDEAIARLCRLCRVGDLPTTLMMTSREVLEMHRAGMEIGAHTVNHPILSALTLNDAEYEIGEGRSQLETIIDAPVDLFAYPNGKPGADYDHRHVALIKRLGFRGAVSTAAGVGRSGDDLFQLPRYTPWNDSLWPWATRLMLNQRSTRFARAVP